VRDFSITVPALLPGQARRPHATTTLSAPPIAGWRGIFPCRF